MIVVAIYLTLKSLFWLGKSKGRDIPRPHCLAQQIAQTLLKIALGTHVHSPRMALVIQRV